MTDDRDTIYALSTGAPPAAIAIVRISGPSADSALEKLSGRLPPPREARLARLADRGGAELDQALVLRFPGPASATGEDIAEMHLHGGRAIVAAVLSELAAMPGLREAAPGEFTRRAFVNGRIDLAEAEGLADLLAAETQSQRRAAQALAGGMLSRRVEAWRGEVLNLAAQVEAALDFSDEGDVAPGLEEEWRGAASILARDMEALLARPAAERLRDGLKVVIAGPPNSGKSSLLNWLAGRQAAITSAVAGTTRDLIEAPTAIAGTPFLLVDTAGLRESEDEVETEGVARARASAGEADILLWLGPPADAPQTERAIRVASKRDLRAAPQPGADIDVSAETGEGMQRLVEMLIERARSLLPAEGDVPLNARHREALGEASLSIEEARSAVDLLVAAEALRRARAGLDRITGRAGVEDMLDALFGRFCVGK